MATFAVIKDNKVTNVIVADTKEIAELIVSQTCVEYTEQNPAGIGWIYNGETFTPPSA
jgi:hypothetical protein